MTQAVAPTGSSAKRVAQVVPARSAAVLDQGPPVGWSGRLVWPWARAIDSGSAEDGRPGRAPKEAPCTGDGRAGPHGCQHGAAPAVATGMSASCCDSARTPSPPGGGGGASPEPARSADRGRGLGRAPVRVGDGARGPITEVVAELVAYLEPGDCIIDGGNSLLPRRHPPRRRRLREGHYVDVGTCGGVWGLERGFCLMIGGPGAVARLEPAAVAGAGVEAAHARRGARVTAGRGAG